MIKTPEEIAIMKEGGAILSRALGAAARGVHAGASTIEIDRLARESMEREGAKPSFLGYRISPNDPAFASTLCISINEEIVHGPATPERTIQDGDVVGLDIGCWYKGLCTDMAMTIMVGHVSDDVAGLVEDTRRSLEAGIEVIEPGKFISDISGAIEDVLKPKGYGIVRDLVGHGVGHAVHEEPQVPNFRDKRASRVELTPGLVLAIEPMVNLGDWHVDMKDDGWTIVSEDGSISAHWEVTVAVTEDGYELITPWVEL